MLKRCLVLLRSRSLWCLMEQVCVRQLCWVLNYNTASCELNANEPTIHIKEAVSKQKHTNSEVLYRSSVKNAATLLASAAKSLQLRPTLCDPIDGSPPGSPVPGVGCHFLLQPSRLDLLITIRQYWWPIFRESVGKPGRHFPQSYERETKEHHIWHTASVFHTHDSCGWNQSLMGK